MSYSQKVRNWSRRSRSNTQVFLILLGLFLGGLLLLFVIAVTLDQDSQTKLADEPTVYDAWSIAQQYVGEQLRSPGSADYGNQSPRDVVAKLTQNQYRVSAWVDSQNAFGGLVRTDFVCDLKYLGDGEWKLERLELHQR